MRRGDTEIVVYGRRGVGEALATAEVEVLSAHASAQLAGAARKQLAAAARARGIRLESCSTGELAALSGDPRNDQGVATRVRLTRVSEVSAFIAAQRGSAAREPRRLLALDGITNSQNVGMIVRSVVASGLDGVLWPLHDTPWVNGLVVKASAGTVLRAPIVRCESLALALAELQGAGFQVIGLEARSGSPLFELRPPHRSVFVVGSETRGLREEIASLLDARVHVPMADGVDSLNVAVSASLLCFHVRPRAGRPAEAPAAC